MNGDIELKAEVSELVKHWFPILAPKGLWGDPLWQLKSAAYDRVLQRLPDFDPEKGKLRSWVYAHVKWAIQNEQTKSGQHVLGATEAGRSKTMPTNVNRLVGPGFQGDGDSISDFPPNVGPASQIANSVIGSSWEPIYDFHTITRAASELDAAAESGRDLVFDSNRNQAPGAWLRFDREFRTKILGEYHNEKERFIATGSPRMSSDECFILLNDPNDRAPEIVREIPYRHRVKVDASEITTIRPTLSDKFSGELKMLAGMLSEFVLKDTSRATAVRVGRELQDKLFDSGFSQNERRYAIAEWFRLYKLMISNPHT